jgi:hypothetical protein
MDQFATITTQILDLNNKVDKLSDIVNLNESYFGYVIAVIIGIITILMMIFLAISVYANRKLEEGRIKDLENKLKNEMQEFIDKKIGTTTKKLEEKIDYSHIETDSNISRLMAITANTLEVHYNSFYWWMRAAKGFTFTKNGELLKTALNRMETELEIIGKKPEEIKSLKDNLSDIEELAQILKTTNKTRIDKIMERVYKLI